MGENKFIGDVKSNSAELDYANIKSTLKFENADTPEADGLFLRIGSNGVTTGYRAPDQDVHWTDTDNTDVIVTGAVSTLLSVTPDQDVTSADGSYRSVFSVRGQSGGGSKDSDVSVTLRVNGVDLTTQVYRVKKDVADVLIVFSGALNNTITSGQLVEVRVSANRDVTIKGTNISSTLTLTKAQAAPVGIGVTSLANLVNNLSGQSGNVVRVNQAGDGIEFSNTLSSLEYTPEVIMPFIPMKGVTAGTFNLLGVYQEIASSLTSNYTTNFSLRNNHAYILINSITGSGDITITGTSVSESTAVPISSDTEVIAVDGTASQYYQSNKKWLEITNISLGTGITAINYNVGVVGYYNAGNNKFAISGYRCDIKTTSKTADMGIKIEKIKDDGGKKFSIITLENFGFDSTNTNGNYIDDLRTAGNDRSYAMGTNLTDVDETVVIKQTDFDSYFTNNENIIDGTKNEGLIIAFSGRPTGGLSGIDHTTLGLVFRNIYA